MKDCPNLADNKKQCSCKSESCPRHGKCCECVKFHRDAGNKPACMRD